MNVRANVCCGVAAVWLTALAGVARGQSLAFTIDSAAPAPTSALSGTIGFTVNFNGTIVGTYTATNTTGSRTINQVNIIFPGNPPPPPRNDALSITGSGGSGATPVAIATVPTGGFRLVANAPLQRVTLSDLAVDLRGASPAPAVPVTASVTFNGGSPFRTVNPTYVYPLFGALNIPLDDAAVSVLRLTQTAPVGGALLPVAGQPGRYTFTLEVPTSSELNVVFQGQDNAAVTPGTTTVNGTLDLSVSPPVCTLSIPQNATTAIPATPGAPVPFPLPAPSLSNPPPPPVPTLATVNVTSGSTTTTGTATLPAGGELLPPADIAQSDGTPGADGVVNNGDFQAFFAAFFLPPTDPASATADIGQSDGTPGPDGAVNNGDFQLFFQAFFGLV